MFLCPFGRPLHRLELHKKGKISEKEAKKYLQKAYNKKDVDYLLNHNK